MAAKISVKESFELSEEYHHVNVDSTRRLFESCVNQGVNKVIFASSAAVYGDSESQLKTVGNEGTPDSPYAENKLEGERISRELSCSETRFACLRFFNVYGPGQSAESQYSAVIPLFFKLLSGGNEITIHGDGSQTRDFVHVRDVCNSIISVSEADIPEFSVSNVGTGSGTTILQLAELICSLGVGSEQGTGRINFSEKRQGDVHHSVADLLGLERIIGKSRFTDLKDGLKEIASSYENQHNGVSKQ